jgi:hypothetical protein
MDLTMSRSPEPAATIVEAPWIAPNDEQSHHGVDPVVQAATAGPHAGSAIVHAALHPRTRSRARVRWRRCSSGKACPARRARL